MGEVKFGPLRPGDAVQGGGRHQWGVRGDEFEDEGGLQQVVVEPPVDRGGPGTVGVGGVVVVEEVGGVLLGVEGEGADRQCRGGVLRETVAQYPEAVEGAAAEPVDHHSVLLGVQPGAQSDLVEVRGDDLRDVLLAAAARGVGDGDLGDGLRSPGLGEKLPRPVGVAGVVLVGHLVLGR